MIVKTLEQIVTDKPSIDKELHIMSMIVKLLNELK